MLQLAVFPSTTLLFLFTLSTATPAAAQLQAGTPVQAVLGWHSTSPHTPLMTCNEGFVPYCCGAFLSDPDDPGNMLCEEGKIFSGLPPALRADKTGCLITSCRPRTGSVSRGVRDAGYGAPADRRGLRTD